MECISGSNFGAIGLIHYLYHFVIFKYRRRKMINEMIKINKDKMVWYLELFWLDNKKLCIILGLITLFIALNVINDITEYLF